MDNTSRLIFDLEVNSEDLQSLQDTFCRSNDMYVICMSKTHGQITSFSGSKSEEDFVDCNFTAELKNKISDSFVDGAPENIVECYGSEDYFLYRGVAIRGEAGRIIGMWLCFGIDKDRLPETTQLPDGIMFTTASQFDKSIALLENFFKLYFEEKNAICNLKKELIEEQDANQEIELRLKKNQIMTDILRLTESEQPFSQVAADILSEAGRYIESTHTAIMQLSEDGKHADMILEWKTEEQKPLKDSFTGVTLTELPFMNGKPYTISSDAVLPEPFEVFFKKNNIKAAIFLPINVNDSAAMYLCIISLGVDRQWTVEEIRFANDVKRLLHSILMKKITTNSLASSYSTLETILQNAGYGVVVADVATKKFLYTNDTFSEMFSNEIDRLAIEEFIFEKRQTVSEVNGYSANGSGKWFDISVNNIRWVDGNEARLITFYDTTDLRNYQKKVEKQAHEDILTGLYNRQACEKDVSLEFHVSSKLGKEFAVLMIDLDNFSDINERYGYKIGDELLEFIAHSINDISGIKGKCYRVGADEFAVIVDHENYKSLDLIVARIMNLFENPWTVADQEYKVTIGMGGVKAPKGIKDPEAILTRLTIAMHADKNQGKNRFEFYDEKADEAASQKMEFENDLIKAVENDCKEFEIYYQPIMEFVNGVPSCCGAEALLRWNSKKDGVLLPEDFIPDAKRLSLMNDLTVYVLVNAAKTCKHWNDFGHPSYKVDVNIAISELNQKDFTDKLDEILKATAVDPQNITIEITDSYAVDDFDKIIATLNRIKALGCRVALDDFGKGYSSLRHMKDMPLDSIKIDRSVVSDMDNDKFSSIFVKSIAELADSLDVDVCLEGIEADKQVDIIGNYSLKLAQGFFFDKPLTKKEFESRYI